MWRMFSLFPRVKTAGAAVHEGLVGQVRGVVNLDPLQEVTQGHLWSRLSLPPKVVVGCSGNCLVVHTIVLAKVENWDARYVDY